MKSMLFWILALMLLALVLFVGLRIARVLRQGGILRTLTELHRPLHDLLERGHRDGYVTIREHGSNKFVQFAKYILDGRQGIEMVFPRVDWSTEYFRVLRDHCVDEGIPYSLSKGSDGTEFLEIDCRRDIEFAYSLFKYVALNVFDLPDDSRFVVSLQNAAPYSSDEARGST